MELVLSEEVAAAGGRIPKVALETSVIAQGLPFPQNLEAFERCESAIRREGAVPATIAILDGRVHVGLVRAQAQSLASGSSNPIKVGLSDLGYAIASKANGGTTVSATAAIAARAGIPVFATGGIGGVHRGFGRSPDVSADLGAIARHPVAVVCSGAKSVLDLEATVEALEALGVPVAGVGTDELPAFLVARSGIRLERRVDDVRLAAAWMRTRFVGLGQGGMVFAVPPPQGVALSPKEVERAIEGAIRLAKARRIKGKALTPFLLSELSRRTGGRTVPANIDLLENNARFAATLAVAYSKLQA